MAGLIKSGSLVEIKPLGREYLHLVGATKGNRYLIQNNRGHINGWITRNNIYGIYSKTLSGDTE